MAIKTAAAGLLLAAFTAVAYVPAGAQDKPPAARPAATSSAVQYANAIHLGYVKNPSALVNNTTQKGLEALSNTLTQRTAIEPAGIVGVDIERDDIALLPFIYWPVTSETASLSPAAQKKVQAYLDTGGFMVFDVRDQDQGRGSSRLLARVLGDVGIKPLVPMAKDHTLTRSFYLVATLPGAGDYKNVWVEQPGPKGSEQISSVIIGDNNWAGAWAGTFLDATSREREMALRSGVNMVMFALMGNYKADQLHVPAILERLGK